MARGGRPGRLVLAAASAVLLVGLLGPGAAAGPQRAGEASFSAPTLFPKFGPNVRDYVVRCHDRAVTVTAHSTAGWQVAIGNHPFQGGDFSKPVRLSAGREFIVTTRRASGAEGDRYHVRCLPDSFPTYVFKRYAPVSPKYFAVDQAYGTLSMRYAIVFNDHGVPIWWHHAAAQATRVLPNGTILWSNHGRSPYRWEIHRLDGTLVRTLDTVGAPANGHDLQVLGDGGYLAGAYVTQSHVDTSAYGGSSDADVVNAELQELSPDGTLVWDWKSQDHIGLDETGRHWDWAIHNPTSQGYDITHWNSIEADGGSVIASFRHLDAVYKIDKATGDIVWKLGGTKTAQSLDVENDPRGAYPFAAQHDARVLPDGTVTVFDNHSSVAGGPRAVRYRIDEQAHTATLIESISDPDVPTSYCCGSARRLSNGSWLISWGKNHPVGGYAPDGERTFLLSLETGNERYSYRAEPVPAGAVSAQSLRDGMNAMYGAP
ncbi:MAG: arylsulfotransferase family protein [Solirubrobacterales bacterium]